MENTLRLFNGINILNDEIFVNEFPEIFNVSNCGNFVKMSNGNFSKSAKTRFFKFGMC